MLCPKCSQPIEEGKAFCKNCGANIQDPDATVAMPAAPAQETAPEETAPVAPEAQAPADTTAPVSFAGDVAPITEGKKLNIKKILLITIPCIVLAVLLIFNMNNIAGFFVKTFASPETYLSYSLAQSIKDPAKGMITSYDNFINGLTDDASVVSAINVKATDKGLESLVSLLEESGTEDIDEEDLAFLKDMSLDTTVNLKEGVANMTGLFNIGKGEIVSAEAILDPIEGSAYMGLPELNESFLEFDLEEDMDITISDYIDMDEETIGKFIDIIQECAPEGKELEDIAIDIGKAALGCIEDVEKGKETLEIGDISQKVTTLSFTLDEEASANMSIAAMEAMLENKDIEKIITNAQETVEKKYEDLGLKGEAEDAVETALEEDWYDLFTDSLEESIDAQEDLLDDESEYSTDVEFTLYIDGDHKMAGYKITDNASYETELADYEEYPEYYDEEPKLEDYVLFVATATKGNKFEYIYTDGEDTIMEGSGKNTGKTLSGTYTIYSSYYNYDTAETEYAEMIELVFEDINQKQWQKGNMKGSFTITPKEAFYEAIGGDSILEVLDLSLKVDMDTTKKDAKINLTLYNDEDELITISTDSTLKGGEKVKAPSDTTKAEDAEDWASDTDFDTLISNLEDAGVPDEWVDAIEQSLDY
ncbi:MAG: zinc ribbon domain-containing protein [Ruminococcus sp.]|nr:zinc ribbon domain-containing protein [Ruminococcus sp.]